MTKYEIFGTISQFIENADVEWRDEVIEFCAKEQAALMRKNEKARERSAAKRAVGDALRERIAGVLGETPLTVAEIMDALGDEDLTPSKVVARLNQLYKAECIGKEQVKAADGRKLMGYFIV